MFNSAKRKKEQRDLTENTLISCGFDRWTIQRAFKVYQKHYEVHKIGYDAQIITEIILRLQLKDKRDKAKRKHKVKGKHKKPTQMTRQDRTYSTPHKNKSPTYLKSRKIPQPPMAQSVSYSKSSQTSSASPSRAAGLCGIISPMQVSPSASLSINPVPTTHRQLRHTPAMITFDNRRDVRNMKPMECDIPINSPCSLSQSVSYSDEFTEHMTSEEASQLKKGDKIDHRHFGGKFVTATVMEKHSNEPTQLRIRYDGHSAVNDLWCDYSQQLWRFAKHETISRRPCNNNKEYANLNIGDNAEINPIHNNPSLGWVNAEIIKIDNKFMSGQVKVKYYDDNAKNEYWIHKDNRNEFGEMSFHPEPIEDEKYIILRTDQLLESPEILEEQRSNSEKSKNTKELYSLWIKFNEELEKDDDKRLGNIFDDSYDNCENMSFWMCFAELIYGDPDQYERVIDDFYDYAVDYERDDGGCDSDSGNDKKNDDDDDAYIMDTKDHCKDKYHLQVLSELYNVKVIIIELDRVDYGIDTSFKYPKDQHHLQIPLIELALIYGRNFNIVIDPKEAHRFPLGPAKERNEETKIWNVRLLQKNTVLRFYCDLYKKLKDDEDNLSAIQWYQFLQSANINEETSMKIYDLSVGKHKTINPGQFVTMMCLIYIAQHSKSCQLPKTSQCLLLLNQMRQIQNGIVLPNMNYPIPVPIQIPPSNLMPTALTQSRSQSLKPLENDDCPSPSIKPYKSAPAPGNKYMPKPLQLKPYNSAPNGKHSPHRPIPELKALKSNEMVIMVTPSTVNGMECGSGAVSVSSERNNSVSYSREGPEIGLTSKQREFKRFYANAIDNNKKKKIYYSKFVENGFNDIEMMMYLDLNTLIKDIGMLSPHAKLFMEKIKQFEQSHQKFKKWLVHELGMEEYLNKFVRFGILTFAILDDKGINNVHDMQEIIGSGVDYEIDAQIIVSKLPKNVRKREFSCLNGNDDGNDDDMNANMEIHSSFEVQPVVVEDGNVMVHYPQDDDDDSGDDGVNCDNDKEPSIIVIERKETPFL